MSPRHFILSILLVALASGCNFTVNIDKEVDIQRRMDLTGFSADCTQEATINTGNATLHYTPQGGGNCVVTADWAGDLVDPADLRAAINDALSAAGVSTDIEVTLDAVDVTLKDARFVDGNDAGVALDPFPSWSMTMAMEGADVLADGDVSGTNATNADGLLDAPLTVAASAAALNVVNQALANDQMIGGEASAEVEATQGSLDTLSGVNDLGFLFDTTLHVVADLDVTIYQ